MEYPATKWVCTGEGGEAEVDNWNATMDEESETRANASDMDPMFGWQRRFGGDPFRAMRSKEWKERAEASMFRKLYK